MPGTPVRPAAATRELSPPVNGTDERLDVLIGQLDRLLVLLDGETVDHGRAPEPEALDLEEPVRPAKKAAAKKVAARKQQAR